ncbi:hypothetical protein [Clostridium sp. HBUAS56017]|uniref:hypothetical protein n=1 Tax=Clostridium sp. HBUAS56017 TaxID=2571128 RepID=UPI001178443A|nr:hypothetical protein [Clostridium sp. HBUAS56017]
MLNKSINAATNVGSNNANSISQYNRGFFDKFERGLRGINLIALSVGLGKLKEKYDVCNFKEFADNAINNMMIIQEFSSISYDLNQVEARYLNTVKALVDISNSFKYLYAKFEQVEDISNKLLLENE